MKLSELAHNINRLLAAGSPDLPVVFRSNGLFHDIGTIYFNPAGEDQITVAELIAKGTTEGQQEAPRCPTCGGQAVIYHVADDGTPEAAQVVPEWPANGKGGFGTLFEKKFVPATGSLDPIPLEPGARRFIAERCPTCQGTGADPTCIANDCRSCGGVGFTQPHQTAEETETP